MEVSERAQGGIGLAPGVGGGEALQRGDHLVEQARAGVVAAANPAREGGAREEDGAEGKIGSRSDGALEGGERGVRGRGLVRSPRGERREARAGGGEDRRRERGERGAVGAAKEVDHEGGGGIRVAGRGRSGERGAARGSPSSSRRARESGG